MYKFQYLDRIFEQADLILYLCFLTLVSARARCVSTRLTDLRPEE